MSDWTRPVTSGGSDRVASANAARTSASSADELVDVGRRSAPVAEPRRPPPRAGAGCSAKSSVPSRNRATATSSAAMSAAVARGPARPASRAMRSAGKRASSGARKSSRPAATRSGGGGRRRAAVGIGQGVLDRKSHVGGAQLGLQGAVDEPDGRVDDALRVDDHLDRVVADIVQPVRLDDLQALVGERRRVDRDLGAHRPGRVAERLLRGDRGERLGRPRRGTARPTRSGSSASTPAIALADEALPDRRVLRVDRPEPGERAGQRVARARSAATPRRSARASGMTRWPPATSVSLLAVATTLPARERGEDRARLTMPPVATTTRSTSSRVASSTSASTADAASCRRQVERRPRRIAGADDRRSDAAACSASSAAVASRSRAATTRNASGEPSRTSSAWRPIDPVEPRSATPARTARPRHVSGRRRGHRASTTGAANRNESTRSSIAAVAGDERARVLRAGRALEHRFGEVAGLGRERQSAAEERAAWSGDSPRPHSISADDDRRGDEPADQPGVGLRRRDVGRGTSSGRTACRRGRRRCRTTTRRGRGAGSSRARRRGRRAARVVGDGRRRVAEPDDERRAARRRARRTRSRSTSAGPSRGSRRVNDATAARTIPIATRSRPLPVEDRPGTRASRTIAEGEHDAEQPGATDSPRCAEQAEDLDAGEPTVTIATAARRSTARRGRGRSSERRDEDAAPIARWRDRRRPRRGRSAPEAAGAGWRTRAARRRRRPAPKSGQRTSAE